LVGVITDGVDDADTDGVNGIGTDEASADCSSAEDGIIMDEVCAAE
jgi:hypothetical protein